MDEKIISFAREAAARARSAGRSEPEPRVANLEAGLSHLERDVGELRTEMRDVRDRLTRLEERVSHLPSKGFIVVGLLMSLAVVAELIVFQAQLEAVFHPQPNVTNLPR